MTPIKKTILWLTIFSIAMGYLETSVVVYLRKLYYPAGFDFPLVPIPLDVALTEFFREAATIIMLIGAGAMSGKNSLQRFVFFLYSFAVWDICYYVFLKLLLGWPASLFTSDILFLIPVPWVGPVIAPCMLSVSMIFLMITVIYFQEKGKQVYLTFTEQLLLVFGSITAIASFIWGYIIYISNSGDDKDVWTLSGNRNMFDEIKSYVPQHFNWWLFSLGQFLILLSALSILFRYKNKKNE